MSRDKTAGFARASRADGGAAAPGSADGPAPGGAAGVRRDDPVTATASEPAGASLPEAVAGGSGGPAVVPADAPAVGVAAAARPDEPAAGGAARPHGAGGPDLVRAALNRARAAARARGVVAGGPGPRPAVRPRTGPVRSGAGPDARDPVPFGALIRRLVQERGWQEQTAAGRVLGDWPRLVGPDVAAHCRPVSLTAGELVVVAESTAWATQLRLLTRTLQDRLHAQVGADVVTSIVVRGPTTADWRRGPRRVRGRGPRDTYG